MSEKLQKLRAAGVAHPNHEFTEEEIERIESLSDAEIETFISVKNKLGSELSTKKHDDDDDGEIHPNTFVV